jgi:4-hydroxybenzoate polyprenyltransferase
VGYATATGTLDWPAFVLFLSCAAWTIGYDTIYAEQDVEDDALVAVYRAASD